MVKDLRIQMGLSQRGFAEKFNIPIRTLQDWEQGRSNPPVYVEELLSNVTNAKKQIKKYELTKRNKWKCFVDRPFKNCDKVYPIQQRKVRELIDDIVKDESVRKVIIFGSSVTDKCHMGSDVDVYCEMDIDRNPITNTHNFEYDFLNNHMVDRRILEEIRKKGVIVYERE